jgi:hypothetical protein
VWARDRRAGTRACAIENSIELSIAWPSRAQKPGRFVRLASMDIASAIEPRCATWI